MQPRRAPPAARATPVMSASSSVGLVLGVFAFLGLATAATLTWQAHVRARSAPPPPVAERPVAPAPQATPPPTAASAAPSAPSPPPSSAPVAQAAATPPRIVEESPAKPKPRYAVSTYWREDASGYERAVQDQKETNAPMLIYFRVDWCPYCKRVDSEVLPTSAVRNFLADVVKVRVNPETSPENKALAARFGVHGYPSIFVVPLPGSPARKVGGYSRQGDEPITVAAENFVEQCKNAGLREAQALAISSNAQDLDRAIDLAPDKAALYERRAEVEEQAGQKGKAVGDLKRAIELERDNMRAYANLGRIYFENQQYDDTIDWLTRAIDVAPDWHQGQLFALRASAYGRKGDETRARTDLAEACRRGTQTACR